MRDVILSNDTDSLRPSRLRTYMAGEPAAHGKACGEREERRTCQKAASARGHTHAPAPAQRALSETVRVTGTHLVYTRRAQALDTACGQQKRAAVPLALTTQHHAKTARVGCRHASAAAQRHAAQLRRRFCFCVGVRLPAAASRVRAVRKLVCACSPLPPQRESARARSCSGAPAGRMRAVDAAPRVQATNRLPPAVYALGARGWMAATTTPLSLEKEDSKQAVQKWWENVTHAWKQGHLTTERGRDEPCVVRAVRASKHQLPPGRARSRSLVRLCCPRTLSRTLTAQARAPPLGVACARG
jgi:hypothetical protein